MAGAYYDDTTLKWGRYSIMKKLSKWRAAYLCKCGRLRLELYIFVNSVFDRIEASDVRDQKTRAANIGLGSSGADDSMNGTHISQCIVEPFDKYCINSFIAYRCTQLSTVSLP